MDPNSQPGMHGVTTKGLTDSRGLLPAIWLAWLVGPVAFGAVFQAFSVVRLDPLRMCILMPLAGAHVAVGGLALAMLTARECRRLVEFWLLLAHWVQLSLIALVYVALFPSESWRRIGLIAWAAMAAAMPAAALVRAVCRIRSKRSWRAGHDAAEGD